MLSRLAGLLRHPISLCCYSFLFFFLLGLLLNFPLSPLSARIEKLARQQQLELRMENPELLFPPGLGVSELEIGSTQIQHPPLLLTGLKLHPLWTTLLGDNPGASFSFTTLQGQVEGTAFRSGDLNANLSALKISEPLSPQLPLTFEAQLDKGQFVGTLPLAGRNSSKLQIELSMLQLTGMQKLGSSSDILPLDKLRCSLEATGEQVTITLLEGRGPAFDLNGTGSLRLGRTPTRSRIDLNLTLSPHAALDPVLKDMLNLLQKPASDGSYRLRLSGSLANPQLQ